MEGNNVDATGIERPDGEAPEHIRVRLGRCAECHSPLLMYPTNHQSVRTLTIFIHCGTCQSLASTRYVSLVATDK